MTACPFCSEDLLATVKPMQPSQLVGCARCLNVSFIQWEDDRPSVIRLDGTESIGEIAPAGSVMAGVFRVLSDVISEMPVAPEVPQRIVAMLHDPLTSMGDLAKIINEDAVTSMKVLRMANSAYFASPHEVTDLKTACSRLGMKAIANIAHAVANGNLYRAGNPKFKGIMQQLWRHGVATAHCADRLSAEIPSINPSLPFVAGLVHDTGKLVLLDILTVKYHGNIGRLRESPDLMVRVLNRFYPVIGLHVVQYWRMPAEYGFSTYFNCKPDITPEPLWAPLTHLVALSSALAEFCGFGVGHSTAPDPAEHPSAVALNLDASMFEDLKSELSAQVESFVEVIA